MLRIRTTRDTVRGVTSATPLNDAAPAFAPNWRQALPVIESDRLTIRPLRPSDAPTLLAMLTTEEVTRFISPPPSTVHGFERFIEWTEAERAAGRLVCFGIVPDGCDAAVGLIQVRAFDPSFAVCEWGFAIGSEFWGTGLFMEAAEKVATYVFDTIGAHRIEARACVENGRGNGALVKLGALQEGLLRSSFTLAGQMRDQYLWAISAERWRTREMIVWTDTVH